MRSGKSLPHIFLSLAVIGSLLLFAENAMASGPQEHTLYTFSGESQGGGPYEMDGLIADQAGNLYGTARVGGQGGGGVVFELTPPSVAGGRWTETVLYSFPSRGDGDDFPMGGLTFDAAGNLYGTTADGGTGYGSAFELSPPAISGGAWTLTTLHQFAGGSDGEDPVTGVILDSNGNVYGTTYYGGAANIGTVFELTPPAVQGEAWTETLLHTFAESNGFYPGGAYPNGGLLLSPEGALLGTTSRGGDADSNGVVFKLVPPATGQTTWREEVLHTFTGGSDGASPFGDLALASGGSFYGVATNGGFKNYGTIYQMTPPAGVGDSWTETTAYTFTGGGNDAYPVSVLLHSGNLYGTTVGFDGVCGEVFELTLQNGVWVETIIHEFATTDGNYPVARLTFNNNKFFGTTLSGGANQQGVFFEVIP